MGWVVDNWKLKLLAVVMSVGLLGAVAFSQNPIKIATVPARIDYLNQPDDMILIQPPTRQNIIVTGLATDLNNLLQNVANVSVQVDLHSVRKGSNITVFGTPVIHAAGNVTSQQDRIPMTLNIDSKVTRSYDVDALTGLAQDSAWRVDSATATPAKITITGPGGYVDATLKVQAKYPDKVKSESIRTSLQVQFVHGVKPVNLAALNTVPAIVFDPGLDVAIDIKASHLLAVDTVYVAPDLVGNPQGGYITSVVVDNPLVQIQGTEELVAANPVLKLNSINVSSLGPGTQKVQATLAPIPSGLLVYTKDGQRQLSQTTLFTVTFTIIPFPQPSPPPPSPPTSPRPSP